jgi:hypothetical protein
MAQRNKLSRLLRRLNTSNARGGNYVAFANLISLDQIDRLFLKRYRSRRNCSSRQWRFSGHINHSRRTIGSNM